MNTRHKLSALLALLTVVPISFAQGQHDSHRHGRVDFPISCSPNAQDQFGTGLALMHHMMYEQAEKAFASAANVDPDCAMAQWGIAMSVIHPLWGERPTEEARQKGQTALEKAKALKAPTAREQAYIAAVEAFYKDWERTTYPAQLAAWEAAQKQLYEAYPDDIDAGAFYALAHLATAPKADKTLAHQTEAGALLEQLHARAPEHPGLFHYIIHAYDNPVLADRALNVARGYDKLAPDVPHALHMPSHIFVRRGLWPDAVAWNVRSAEAAWRQPAGAMVSMHYAHALDYLAYAYLQMGQDERAREVVAKMSAAENLQPALGSAYALAAVPARYTLERARWAEAAALPVRTPASFPWDKYPAAESITYFARGLGAARSGDAAAAREAIRMLDGLYDHLVKAGEDYWAVLTDAQRKTVTAWLTFSEGDTDGALKTMQAAADLEDSVDKHPVTPSPVLPARELLGDMLVLLDKPNEATAAYLTSLKTSPNRFNSLYGVGRAAQQAGHVEMASTYYKMLVDLSAGAGDERPELRQARLFLTGK